MDETSGAPVDLTGLSVCSQIRPASPVAAAGVPTTDPLLELTTPDYYATAPEWPVYEGWSIPEPTSGTMVLVVPRDTFLPLLNPTNVKVKYVWDVVVKAADGTIQPIVSGKPLFLPGTTF